MTTVIGNTTGSKSTLATSAVAAALLLLGSIAVATPGAEAAYCSLQSPEGGVSGEGDKCACRVNLVDRVAECAACDYPEGQSDCNLEYGG